VVEVEREGKERESSKRSNRRKGFFRDLELHLALEREQRQIQVHEGVERVVDVLLERRDRRNSRMDPRVVL